MSSLAAVQADGYYKPPEYADVNANKLHKRVAYDARNESARKRGGGQVIRFEIPFNLLCQSCGKRIAKGARFNAEKTRIGWYYSTPVWRFQMHTVCCATPLVLCTDPGNRDFVVEAGARRKTEEYDADAAGTLEVDDARVARKKRDERDALDNAEKDALDKQKARAANERIASLHERNDAVWSDDYTTSKALRRVMRERRRAEKARDMHRQNLGLPASVHLHTPTEEDKNAARSITFASKSAGAMKKRKRADIESESIFNKSKTDAQWDPQKLQKAVKRSKMEAAGAASLSSAVKQNSQSRSSANS